MIVFLRAPQAGKVKTRLARAVGAKRALALYRCFAEDLLDTLAGLDVAVTVFFTPPEAGDAVRRWLGPRYRLEAQAAGDLGERMAEAFRRTFRRGADRAVLVGSDLPDLPGDIVREAVDSLDGRGAVIGPALDGGYYLIGFRAGRFHPGCFEGIAWSRGDVFRRTMDRFREGRLDVHVLPRWGDIDDHGDLKRFVADRGDHSTAGARTAGYLKSIHRL